MEKRELAQIIDHTNLKADATAKDIQATCQAAKIYGFRGVCVNLRWVKLAKEELRGTPIKVITVIDWPCGASPLDVRYFATKVAKEDGADEIDPVMDIGNFKAGNSELVLEDLKSLAKVLPCKVIIETGFLSEDEIKQAARIVKEAGALAVKTSTGKEPRVDLETKAYQIRLIRQVVGPEFLIKAAGGIRTFEDALKMVEAGADIIGTSSGVEIVK